LKIISKHDEDSGSIGEKNISGLLGSVRNDLIRHNAEKKQKYLLKKLNFTP
jgi:hypothetical protein